MPILHLQQITGHEYPTSFAEMASHGPKWVAVAVCSSVPDFYSPVTLYELYGPLWTPTSQPLDGETNPLVTD